MQSKLREVREWALSQITTRGVPAWDWYQYMKLVETCDAILAGMVPTPDEKTQHEAVSHLRFVGPGTGQDGKR